MHWHEATAGPSGIYSGVQLWTDSNANVGPSREYNIDLAPKVSNSNLHDCSSRGSLAPQKQVLTGYPTHPVQTS